MEKSHGISEEQRNIITEYINNHNIGTNFDDDTKKQCADNIADLYEEAQSWSTDRNDLVMLTGQSVEELQKWLQTSFTPDRIINNFASGDKKKR